MPKKKIGLSAWLLGVNQQFIIQNTHIQQNSIYLFSEISIMRVINNIDNN